MDNDGMLHQDVQEAETPRSDAQECKEREKTYRDTKEYKDWRNDFKERIIDMRRAQARKNQTQMAKILGRKISSYRRIELGEVDMSLYEAILFADACHDTLYRLAMGKKTEDMKCSDLTELIHQELSLIGDEDQLRSVLLFVQSLNKTYNNALEKGRQEKK